MLVLGESRDGVLLAEVSIISEFSARRLVYRTCTRFLAIWHGICFIQRQEGIERFVQVDRR